MKREIIISFTRVYKRLPFLGWFNVGRGRGRDESFKVSKDLFKFLNEITYILDIENKNSRRTNQKEIFYVVTNFFIKTLKE